MIAEKFSEDMLEDYPALRARDDQTNSVLIKKKHG